MEGQKSLKVSIKISLSSILGELFFEFEWLLLPEAKLVPQQYKTSCNMTVFLTFIPVELISTVGFGAVVKVPLQSVHLSAENIPKGLHLC